MRTWSERVHLKRRPRATRDGPMASIKQSLETTVHEAHHLYVLYDIEIYLGLFNAVSFGDHGSCGGLDIWMWTCS